MSDWLGHQESWVEIGLAAFGAVLLAGIGFLLVGRIAGRSQTGSRAAEPPPPPGSVPDERHQHTAVAATR